MCRVAAILGAAFFWCQFYAARGTGLHCKLILRYRAIAELEAAGESESKGQDWIAQCDSELVLCGTKGYRRVPLRRLPI